MMTTLVTSGLTWSNHRNLDPLPTRLGKQSNNGVLCTYKLSNVLSANNLLNVRRSFDYGCLGFALCHDCHMKYVQMAKMQPDWSLPRLIKHSLTRCLINRIFEQVTLFFLCSSCHRITWWVHPHTSIHLNIYTSSVWRHAHQLGLSPDECMHIALVAE